MRIIVAGKMYVQKDRRDEYVAAFENFVRRTRNEPGCLDLIVAADPLESDRINNFELWASKKELDAFRQRSKPPGVDIEILKADMQKHEIASSGPPFP